MRVFFLYVFMYLKRDLYASDITKNVAKWFTYRTTHISTWILSVNISTISQNSFSYFKIGTDKMKEKLLHRSCRNYPQSGVWLLLRKLSLMLRQTDKVQTEEMRNSWHQSPTHQTNWCRWMMRIHLCFTACQCVNLRTFGVMFSLTDNDAPKEYCISSTEHDVKDGSQTF